ncbi:hypothetical protein BHE74_00017208 [Ensete ventricosum]|nr:hypothetical protein BHE74_00017208 [Ensete ventricosum]
MMSEWWVKKGPGGNLPGVTNENLRPGINVSHEERENDVGGEEGVDDVVGEEQPTLGRSVHERDLEGIHPCRPPCSSARGSNLYLESMGKMILHREPFGFGLWLQLGMPRGGRTSLERLLRLSDSELLSSPCFLQPFVMEL